MSEATKTAEAQLKKFQELDVKRKRDPVLGQRACEGALFELCQTLMSAKNPVEPAVKTKIVATLQAMNLVPYRSYCREHLLDIGIVNI